MTHRAAMFSLLPSLIIVAPRTDPPRVPKHQHLSCLSAFAFLSPSACNDLPSGDGVASLHLLEVTALIPCTPAVPASLPWSTLLQSPPRHLTHHSVYCFAHLCAASPFSSDGLRRAGPCLGHGCVPGTQTAAWHTDGTQSYLLTGGSSCESTCPDSWLSPLSVPSGRRTGSNTG